MPVTKCCFCGESVGYMPRRYDKIVTIVVEDEEDGARVDRKYWAHWWCIPEELKTDG